MIIIIIIVIKCYKVCNRDLYMIILNIIKIIIITMIINMNWKSYFQRVYYR